MAGDSFRSRSIHSASDIADRFDQHHAESTQFLLEWVGSNPSTGKVIAAATLATCMDVGKGFVDVLRLGEGAAQGTVKGFLIDGLRLVSLAGPIGRAAKIAGTARNARIARLIADPGGPRCSWINAAKAMRHSGQKLFASVDDLAQSVGIPLKNMKGVHLSEIVDALRQIGAKVGNVIDLPSFDLLRRLVPRDGGVVLVGLRAFKNGKKLDAGHAVYAFRDAFGRLRFMDRSGHVFSSIDDLAKAYSAKVDRFGPKCAAVVKNGFMKFVGPKGTATLTLEVQAIILQQEVPQPAGTR